MSVKVLKLVRTRDLARPAVKAVLLDMAFYASDDGSGVWPSNSTLQAGTGWKETAVRDALKTLNELGLIKLVGVVSGKNGSTEKYDLDLNAIAALSKNKLAKTQPEPVRETNPTGSGNEPLPVRETNPNSNSNRKGIVSVAKKIERAINGSQYAHESDHLIDDDRFAVFEAEMEARGQG